MADSGQDLESLRWLVSDTGQSWLRRLRGEDPAALKTAQRLRRDLTAGQVRALLRQLRLRARAGDKFRDAERMFFTDRSLEQASDDIVASYKAARFPPRAVCDLCCGLGGDLIQLSTDRTCLAVDSDPVMVLLAEANCRALGRPAVTVGLGHAEEVWPDGRAVHIDPDRRTTARRATDVERFSPSWNDLKGLAALDDLAIKLAPATPLPEAWPNACTREWIATRGECRQQVLWSGRLADQPGCRRATRLVAGESPLGYRIEYSITGRGAVPIPAAERLGAYLFEPDRAVLAARLAGELEARHRLTCAYPPLPYLTGDWPLDEPALAAFQIEAELPFDRRRIRHWLRRHRRRISEVKKRGTSLDPGKLLQELGSTAGEPVTLILAGADRQVTAVLASRT